MDGDGDGDAQGERDAQGGRAPGGDGRDAHVPVMLTECVEALAGAESVADAVLVDCTLGLGGHSEALLTRYPQARLLGLDRDPQALERSRARLAGFGERFEAVHAVYDELPDVLAARGIKRVHGVLFDLGVSSMQLDVRERGFAYAYDAPLDMRMDQTASLTAYEVVNTYPVEELTRILRDYGEERFARRVAQAIVARREREPIERTGVLAELVRESIPAATRRTGGHPAKRAFQALRIEVNGELDVLSRAIPRAADALAVGGRIAVLSYHSLEDRLVKRVFAAGATSTAPRGLPVAPPGTEPVLRLLTRGAQEPSPEETAANPRAASAKFRAAERVRPGSVQRRLEAGSTSRRAG